MNKKPTKVNFVGFCIIWKTLVFPEVCPAKLLLVLETEVLHVDSLLHGFPLDLGRLLERLAGTELADGTGLFELSLELFQSALDVFAFFNRYNNHFFITSFFFSGCKGNKIF